MKSILILCLLLACSFQISAQVMASKAQWVTIKSANLRCWICKEKLENYLKSENYTNWENGMLQWRTNLMSGEIRIQYNPDRVTPDDIRVAMNNAGFDADTTKAEPDSYKRLPLLCKRSEDGGGPQPKMPCSEPPKQN
jgi:hypothetical protein